jgi:hypothetical protein
VTMRIFATRVVQAPAAVLGSDDDVLDPHAEARLAARDSPGFTLCG